MRPVAPEARQGVGTLEARTGVPRANRGETPDALLNDWDDRVIALSLGFPYLPRDHVSRVTSRFSTSSSLVICSHLFHWERRATCLPFALTLCFGGRRQRLASVQERIVRLNHLNEIRELIVGVIDDRDQPGGLAFRLTPHLLWIQFRFLCNDNRRWRWSTALHEVQFQSWARRLGSGARRLGSRDRRQWRGHRGGSSSNLTSNREQLANGLQVGEIPPEGLTQIPEAFQARKVIVDKCPAPRAGRILMGVGT